jgi:multiple sugar transport system ATP-binding protein
MARVQLKNVAKRWGASTAVERLSLDIADGEFLVLLGPSGCGKTTTMRMVAGLEDASEGEVWIGDRRVDTLEPKDRDVAMVFQSYGLYPNMTVAENIAFPLKIRGLPVAEINAAVARAAQQVELTDYMQRKPKELSGGQRQRVALARAIVRRPAVFLMDEPLSNLDAKLRVTMRAHLKRLHHTLGVTTIYVTHDQIEAMTLADRVVVMSRARVQQVGTPQAIYERPANLFVAGFMGSPPMNLLHGHRSGGGFTPAPKGPLVLGARAEDLVPMPAPQPVPQPVPPLTNSPTRPGFSFTGEVFSFELTGDSSFVTLSVGEQLMTARAGKDFRAAIGQPLTLALAPAQAHWFDAESGLRLADEAAA